MSKGLSRKKKTRGGHRVSAQRTIRLIYEAIESTDAVESVYSKLEQYKIALQEKLDVVKKLDVRILDLVDEDELEEEIGLADEFKEKVCKAIFDSTKTLETKRTLRAAVTVLLATTLIALTRLAQMTLPEGQQMIHGLMTLQKDTPLLAPRKFNGELAK